MSFAFDPMTSPIGRLLPKFWWQLDWNIAWLRVSARQKDKLANNTEAALVLHGHPAMQHVDEVGGITQLLTNRALQRRLGLIEIRRRDASVHAAEPGALMGYVWVIQDLQCALVLLTDSAAELNVAVPGEPLPGNAAMHLLQTLLLMPNVTELHAASWDRLVRENRMGALVISAAQIGHTKVYSGGQLADLYSRGGKFYANSETVGAANHRDTARESTTNGALAKLMRAQIAWPYSRRLTPTGYVAERGEDDGTGEKRIALLRADSEHSDTWTLFFRAVAAGDSWARCGQILADAKVPVRGQRLRRGKTFADLNHRQLKKAALSAASLRHIRELRTLTYEIAKPVPVPNDGTWSGYLVQPGGTYGCVRQTVALPEHNIRLTDAEWDACEARIETSPSRVPTGERLTSMAASIPTWQDDDTRLQYKLHSYPGYYQLRSRPRESWLSENGTPRGWFTGEGTLVGSFAKADFDRALGQLIEQGGTALLEEGAVFTRPASRTVRQPQETEQIRLALESQRLEAEDHVDVCRAGVAAATDANRRARESKLEVAISALQDIETAMEQLRPTAPPAQRIENVSLDIAEFAALAGVLREAAGQRMPRVVNDSVLQLVGRSLRVTSDPTRPMVALVSATLRARDTEGGVVEVPVQTTVRNAQLAVRAEGQRASDAAALILHDGIRLQEAAEMFGVLPARLAKEVRSWARQHGVFDERRAAKLIDCPVQEVRRTAWAMMTGEEPVGDDRFIASILSGYFAEGKRPSRSTWVMPMGDIRRVMRALELAEGRGLNLADGIEARELAAATGLTTAEVLQMAAGADDRFARPLRRHAEDPRVVAPWKCPGCDRWLTHVLMTEETRSCSGLVCIICCTTADGAPVPADFVRLWDASADDLTTVERTADDYVAQVPGQTKKRRVGMKEATRLTGIAGHVLRAATDNGQLPCVRRGGTRERWFDPRDLDTFANRNDEGTGRVPSLPEVPDGHVTLKEAAKEYQVAEHVLRRLLLSTGPDELPVRYIRTTAGRANVLAARRTDLDAMGSDWFARHRVGLLKLSDVMDRTGLTPSQLRRLMDLGEFPHSRTDRGTAVFDPDDVARWMQGPGRALRLLSPCEAAALASCTPDQLRKANKRGQLPAYVTPAGHRRYAEEDVVEWQSRRSTTAQPDRLAA